jgi:ATP-dependent DNA helicase DinG
VTATAAETSPATFAEAEILLATSLPGYTPRPLQQRLAEQVEMAIEQELILLAEAGTGTGKSYAALIPAILAAIRSGKRTVVATATNALLTQYIRNDLPFLQKHLGVAFKWAGLKGRSNYPCALKADELKAPSRLQAEIIDILSRHADDTVVVLDRDHLPTVTNTEWMQLSMTSSECPGATDCPFAAKGLCHAQRAKALAAEADVVITNLAYLATDLKLRADSEGRVALLGEFDQLIVDEAHNLDSAITSALSDRIGLGTFSRLSGDTGAYLRDVSFRDEADPANSAAAVGYAATELWRALDDEFASWQARQRQARADSTMMPVTQRVRYSVLSSHLHTLAEALQQLWGDIRRSQPASEKQKNAKNRLERRVTSLIARMQSFVLDEDTVTVRWAEVEEDKTFLRSVPVSPAPFLNQHLWGHVPSILMSATLAAGRKGNRADFSYTTDILGLEQHSPRTFEAGTSFDYPKQAMLYVPERTVPIPSGKEMPAWRSYAQETTRFLVTQSGGGALLLFTSRANLEDAWNRLSRQFEDAGLLVMKQGDAPPAELIARFKKDGNSVLFALRTFFEGIDIPGDALRLVIVDKLPFPVPTDLQFAARCDAVNKRAGRDVSFGKLSMPMMTLPLIQALGRLLRHADDRGVIAILDPRLTSKGYGGQILDSLPPAKVTTDPHEAAAFLKA